MNLGSAFAILVVLGVLLAVLLCILLKCYHMKMQKSLKDTLGVYGDDEMMSQELVTGAYEEFRARREKQKELMSSREDMSQIDIERFIQRPALRKIIDLDNDIYGISSIKKRLEIDTSPFSFTSATTLRQSAFSKIGRTPGGGNFLPETYKFIQQLVRYDQEGIMVTEVIPTRVTRGIAGMVVRGKMREVHHQSVSVECLEWCELCGFEEGSYGWCKYVCGVEVGGVRQGDGAEWKNLRYSINKLAIEKEEWEKARRAIKSQFPAEQSQSL